MAFVKSTSPVFEIASRSYLAANDPISPFLQLLEYQTMEIPCELDLTVSDPWDFAIGNDEGPFRVMVLKDVESKMLVEFPFEFFYEGKKSLFFVVYPRYKNQSIAEQLRIAGYICVNIDHIPYNDRSDITEYDFRLPSSYFLIGAIHLKYTKPKKDWRSKVKEWMVKEWNMRHCSKSGQSGA